MIFRGLIFFFSAELTNWDWGTIYVIILCLRGGGGGTPGFFRITVWGKIIIIGYCCVRYDTSIFRCLLYFPRFLRSYYHTCVLVRAMAVTREPNATQPCFGLFTVS